MSAQNKYDPSSKHVDQYNSLIDNIENKLRTMTTRRPNPPRKPSPQYLPTGTASKKSHSEYINVSFKKDDPPIH